eukprot:Gb_40019 [translate_table: standard]
MEVRVEKSKHFCKICKRRFPCGRALGGHMRIHGTAAAELCNATSALSVDSEKKRRCSVSEPEARDRKQDEADDSPMYSLRPNRKQCWRFADGGYSFLIPADVQEGFGATLFSNSPVCDDCGKEFSSWKALFAHTVCHSHSDPLLKTHDDGRKAEEEEWSSESEEEQVFHSESDAKIDETTSGESPHLNLPPRSQQWTRGSRSKRPRYAAHQSCSEEVEEKEKKSFCASQQNEEEETARCLVMLSNAGGFWGAAREADLQGEEESENSQSMRIQLPIAEENASELDKFGKKRPKLKDHGPSDKLESQHISKKGSYECKACNKIFYSFQALGGHRASHKNVKGCSARTDMQEREDESVVYEIITSGKDLPIADPQLPANFQKNLNPRKHQVKEIYYSCEDSYESLGASEKSKVYECSICKRIFASGQALGGHKRCHWVAAGNSESTVSTISAPKQSPVQEMFTRHELPDLNLPAASAKEDDWTYIGTPINAMFMESRTRPIPCYIQQRWSDSN